MKKVVEKKRQEKIDYKEVVLKTIFAVSVLSVAVMAPNALQMFSFLKKKDKYQVQHRVKSKTLELMRSGYVEKKMDGLHLTLKGQGALLKYSDYATKKPKKWDGLWTIVSYDILDKKKTIRDSLRFQLKRIGFIQLQKSVWVFPYDCPELIYLVKTEWKLKDELVYIRAKYISREKKLKKYFDL